MPAEPGADGVWVSCSGFSLTQLLHSAEGGLCRVLVWRGSLELCLAPKSEGLTSGFFPSPGKREETPPPTPTPSESGNFSGSCKIKQHH